MPCIPPCWLTVNLFFFFGFLGTSPSALDDYNPFDNLQPNGGKLCLLLQADT